MLRLPEPKVNIDRNPPDVDTQNGLVLDTNTLLLNLGYIREQQNRYRRSRPNGLRVGAGNVWRATNDKVWVPKRARELKNALYAVAHQGPAAHRGKELTLGALELHFHWKNMERDVEQRRSQCLRTMH